MRRFAFLHLAVLWAFAFAQPLFDLLADNPEFFVARDNGRADILIFAIGMVLIPPALMVGVERLAGLADRRLERGVHLGLIGLLVAATALQLLKDVASRPAGILIVLALLLGAAAAYAYARGGFLPTALTYLSPVPVLFLVLFLVTSPVSKLILPQGEEEAAASNAASRVPVVFVVFDEFPATSLMDEQLHVDRNRYPNFAELADSSTWYRNATTVGDYTENAVPALLSGNRPEPDALPTAGDHPNNLFTLLDRYRMRVLETVTEVCPERLCPPTEAAQSLDSRLNDLVSDLSLVSEHLLLPDAIRDHLTPVDQTFGNFRQAGADQGEAQRAERDENRAGNFAAALTDRPQLWQRFLDSIDGASRTLHFLHIAFPHRPWQYLPSGQDYPLHRTDISRVGVRPGTDEAWGPNPWPPRHGLQRHLLQTGFTDRLLGQLIARMKREGIWNRALMVITADHGVSFHADQPARIPDPGGNEAEITNVPLFVKSPGQRTGRLVERHTETIDVLPTVADLLGARIPFQVDGHSAQHGDRESDVVVQRGIGGIIRLPFEEFLAQQRDVVLRNAALFANGDDWSSVYRVGPGRELLGKRAAPLAGQPSPARIYLRGYRGYREVDPNGPSVPILVAGRIDGPLRGGSPLAIAVNGRIAAMSEVYELPEERGFLSLVPPASLARGPNRVEVFVVEGSGEALRLRSLGAYEPRGRS